MDLNPQPYGNGPVQWVLGALVGLLGYLFNIYRLRVDQLVASQAEYVTRDAIEALSQLQKTAGSFVTREELAQAIDRIQTERWRMHAENQEGMKDVRALVERVHQRVDQIWELKNK